MTSQIAVIGMGVMGRNLALNLADRGHKVAIYNRSYAKTEDALTHKQANHQLAAYKDIENLVQHLDKPRTILLMVTAGQAVDKTIESLLPHLEAGDIIIDGGNSNFHDTERRYKELKNQQLLYIGAGVSGGEDGARYGPSIMVGGDPAAWPIVKPYLQSIAARTDDDEVCCQWVGEGGAGHYVKMIHNGIEYGDMQLIAEIWYLMHQLDIADDEIANVFKHWNQGVLSSYLIEITADILTVKDDDGSLRVLNILDSAGQKGTGRWTAINSFELGAPLTLITESVYARVLSSFKQQRVKASTLLSTKRAKQKVNLNDIKDDLGDALYASKIISYAQGFMQMSLAAKQYGWVLDFGNIALLWRAGCIIRSVFLKDIKQAFANNPELDNLVLDQYFSTALKQAEQGWRKTCVLGIQSAVPLPATLAALNFFDAYRSAQLPANLVQAQRDYFGAHTYQRLDKEPEQFFHTQWTHDQKEIKV